MGFRSQIAILLVLLGLATPAAAAPLPLDTGWQFRWDDPGVEPRTLGAWTAETRDADWATFSPRMPPPGRDGRKVVWYRVRLPQALAADTALFIPGSYQLFEIYLAGKKHYAWGEFDATGAKELPGSPFHTIALPPDAGGQWLYLRIFSDFKNIGITGPMLLGTPVEHVQYVVSKDLHRVVLGAIFCFTGIFQFFLFRRRQNFAEYLAFGFFCLSYGVHAVTRTQLRQLIVDAPQLWKLLEITTILMLPIGLLVFVERVFGAGWRNGIRRIWQANAAASLLILPLSFWSLALLEWGLSVFQALFVPGCALVMASVLPKARRGHRDAQIFVLAMLCLTVPGAIDGLVVGGQIPWIDPISPIGVLGFVLALQIIMSRRLAAERHDKFVLERELETAAIFSSSFLPKASFRDERFQIEAVFQPADKIGGDWFAYYLYKNRWLHAHIGDVTGHGPASALLAAYAKGAADSIYAEHEQRGAPGVSLDALHQTLNGLLSRASETPAFMTLFSIAIDLETGRMEYINSGHMFQFVCSGASPRNAILTGHGRSILGAFPNAAIVKPDRLALGGDETIFMFSDGLLEAIGKVDGRGQKHFYEGLKGAAEADAPGVRDRVLKEIERNAGGRRRPDDITFVVIKLSLGALLARRRAG